MPAPDSLSPRQFPSEDRLAAMKSAKSRPGTEVFYGSPKDRYIDNPLGSHLGPHEPVGSYYRKNAVVSRPVMGNVPIERLESSQSVVSRTHVNNMVRRKGTPPPIEVTHHTDHDRYFVSEGNHRVLAAMKQGKTHIRAEVTKVKGY